MKCLVPFKKDQHPVPQQRNNDNENITANIIFNLAHLGISIEDTKTFDLNTYFKIVKLEMKIANGHPSERRATQKDIDSFLI